MLYSRKSVKIGARVAGVHATLLVSLITADLLQRSFRADMACHWEDGDVVAQEMYYNVRK